MGCDDIVYSLHRHDYRSCRCGAVGLDGGRDYSRVILTEGADFKSANVIAEGDLTRNEAIIAIRAYRGFVEDGDRSRILYLQHLGLVDDDERPLYPLARVESLR